MNLAWIRLYKKPPAVLSRKCKPVPALQEYDSVRAAFEAECG
jgi:hypothetical protein